LYDCVRTTQNCFSEEWLEIHSDWMDEQPTRRRKYARTVTKDCMALLRKKEIESQVCAVLKHCLPNTYAHIQPFTCMPWFIVTVCDHIMSVTGLSARFKECGESGKWLVDRRTTLTLMITA
jgi:hypothetical protein